MAVDVRINVTGVGRMEDVMDYEEECGYEPWVARVMIRNESDLQGEIEDEDARATYQVNAFCYGVSTERKEARTTRLTMG